MVPFSTLTPSIRTKASGVLAEMRRNWFVEELLAFAKGEELCWNPLLPGKRLYGRTEVGHSLLVVAQGLSVLLRLGK